MHANSQNSAMSVQVVLNECVQHNNDWFGGISSVQWTIYLQPQIEEPMPGTNGVFAVWKPSQSRPRKLLWLVQSKSINIWLLGLWPGDRSGSKSKQEKFGICGNRSYIWILWSATPTTCLCIRNRVTQSTKGTHKNENLGAHGLTASPDDTHQHISDVSNGDSIDGLFEDWIRQQWPLGHNAVSSLSPANTLWQPVGLHCLCWARWQNLVETAWFIPLTSRQSYTMIAVWSIQSDGPVWKLGVIKNYSREGEVGSFARKIPPISQ